MTTDQVPRFFRSDRAVNKDQILTSSLPQGLDLFFYFIHPYKILIVQKKKKLPDRPAVEQVSKGLTKDENFL